MGVDRNGIEVVYMSIVHSLGEMVHRTMLERDRRQLSVVTFKASPVGADGFYSGESSSRMKESIPVKSPLLITLTSSAI